MKKRFPRRNPLNWPNNWMLKMLSLFFALFLWYFVVGEDKVDTSVFIPVQTVNLPRDLIISNQFKQQLEVRVSGPRSLIDGIRRQNITRTINLSKATPGTMVVRNEPHSIPFPRGINVLRIQPTHITLLIDRLIEKNLPIRAVLTGKPAKNYEVAAVQFDPPSITISGPRAVIAGENVLTTKPLDINGLNKTTTKQIHLNLRQEIIELIGETVVTAKIVITEKRLKKTIANIPVTLINKEEGKSYRLSVKKIKATAELPISLARKAKGLTTRFRVAVDVAGLPPGKHRVNVALSADAPIQAIAPSPKTVTVTVREAAKPRR